MIFFEALNELDLPIFTIAFCGVIFIIYILDNFLVIPKTETVTAKEKLWTGHNKGCINHALHLSEKKIKSGDYFFLPAAAAGLCKAHTDETMKIVCCTGGK